jgi:adenomatosis polyposis coli protein
LVKETKNEEANKKGKFSEHASGLQSPEKTVNYCVEGTPGDFSRNDSLSDLEEASHSPRVPKVSSQPSTSKIPPPLLIKKEIGSEKESVAATPKSVTFLADETPLMFSRTSSMGSIDSAEQGFDDKSSVVSDFSRLASGVISPSELPDSPTQSVPQSPSRSQMRVNHASKNNLPTINAPTHEREIIGAEAAEDSVNTFNVENTPAVFSSRTSLSNLSFDDEPKISNDAISKDFQLMKHPSEDEDSKVAKKSETFGNDVTAEQSDAEESADDANLLESCINMGINSINVKGKKSPKPVERNGKKNLI